MNLLYMQPMSMTCDDYLNMHMVLSYQGYTMWDKIVF